MFVDGVSRWLFVSDRSGRVFLLRILEQLWFSGCVRRFLLVFLIFGLGLSSVSGLVEVCLPRTLSF